MTAAVEYGLVLGSALALAAASVADVVASRRAASGAAGRVALGLATAGLFLAIAIRWAREEQGPFFTMYDILLSNTFSLSAIYFCALLFAPVYRATTPFVWPLLLILALWTINAPGDSVPLPASYDNPWLWLHVLSGKLFLGACMVAAAAAMCVLTGRQAHRLEVAVWPALSIAFVCHSFMLLAGAVWAHSAWGRYWAWDPLETWSFLTWLVMAVILHARVTFRRLPLAVGHIGIVVIFVLAFLTFFGVPFVSTAPHKGVM